MSSRYQLTDAQWGHIEPLFSYRGRMGRTTCDPRMMLDGILWVLHTGAPWRDLPERFGPWNTVYNTFRRWQKVGRIDAILERLQLRLIEAGSGITNLCVRRRTELNLAHIARWLNQIINCLIGY